MFLNILQISQETPVLESPTQLFSCEICEIFKNIFFPPPVAVSLIYHFIGLRKMKEKNSQKNIHNEEHFLLRYGESRNEKFQLAYSKIVAVDCMKTSLRIVKTLNLLYYFSRGATWLKIWFMGFIKMLKKVDLLKIDELLFFQNFGRFFIIRVVFRAWF